VLLPLFEACVAGVEEVMGALISSVLTTLAVFVPLVFLSGSQVALFFEHGVAVAAVLSVFLGGGFYPASRCFNLSPFLQKQKSG